MSDNQSEVCFWLKYIGQRRFLRLRFPLGLCRVDQQNACTSRIPAVTPILSMLTSRTEGPRSATKDWWYSSNPAKPTQMAPASRISQIPLTP